jgi:XTP/dITP diphosphohydrolase
VSGDDGREVGLPARIVLASANPKKAAELVAVLGERFGDRVEVVPRPPEVPEVVEDAADFEGNARLKAEALAAATGEWALADDSGLEVDALGGAPGVRSARFAGDDADDAANLAELIARLAPLAADDPGRRARFRCVLVLAAPPAAGEGPTEVVCHGTVEGRIAAVARGEAGFGYDPVFVPDEGDGRTFAEMAPGEKHAISHRGRALRSLARAVGGGSRRP